VGLVVRGLVVRGVVSRRVVSRGLVAATRTVGKVPPPGAAVTLHVLILFASKSNLHPTGNGTNSSRSTGHVVCFSNHMSMHSRWNTCPQCNLRTSSSFSVETDFAYKQQDILLGDSVYG
jgi:hypothetical protein